MFLITLKGEPIMEIQQHQHDSPTPRILNDREWRDELNAAEVMAGQLRERLRSLKKSAESEAGSNANTQAADWWRMAAERLDNGIFEADQISDALAVMDSDLPELNRP